MFSIIFLSANVLQGQNKDNLKHLKRQSNEKKKRASQLGSCITLDSWIELSKVEKELAVLKGCVLLLL